MSTRQLEWDACFMAIASRMAAMGTCHRRQVGCVLVDYRNIIVTTGFNGPPPGFEHCRNNEYTTCPAKNAPSGTALDGCEAVHAEQNAVNFCKDILRPKTCYTTASPCIQCVKSLMCTGVSRIVYQEDYPHPEAKKLWTRQSMFFRGRGTTLVAEHRTWEKYTSPGDVRIVASSGLK